METVERKNSLGKRYIVFIIGLFVNSLGVSLITKASLGTSPISSIPYVLSLNFPFTLGEFTIFFSILLILLQILILGKRFQIYNLLQIPVSLAFGYFIDFCMFLLDFWNPQAYWLQVVSLLIGCGILAIGVYMEVLADVVMLPGESFVRAVVSRWKTEFGTTKVVFDVSMSVIAAVLSFVCSGTLQGVREGTVVAALLVGFLARVIGRQLPWMPEKLFGAAVQQEAVKEQGGICIAVGRQYGSGGRELSKKLADRLGFAFYDKEIIQMTAGSTGFSQKEVEEKEETMTGSLLYDLFHEAYGYSGTDKTPKDEIFAAESKVILEAAKKDSVIVDRCSNWVLRNDLDCIRVFFAAPLEKRVRRIMEREKLSEPEALRKVQSMDKKRGENYRYYTRCLWGNASQYTLCLDTSLGEETVLSILQDLVEKKRKEHK